jgi:hypothetical protein
MAIIINMTIKFSFNPTEAVYTPYNSVPQKNAMKQEDSFSKNKLDNL